LYQVMQLLFAVAINNFTLLLDYILIAIFI
jgi:hypothetical protein